MEAIRIHLRFKMAAKALEGDWQLVSEKVSRLVMIRLEAVKS